MQPIRQRERAVSVNTAVIQDAVLQVFADLQVTAGGHLSMDCLRTEWPRMRLRRSDLVQGVRELVFAGHLELDEDFEGALLILTPQGEDRLRARPQETRSVWKLLVSKKPAPPAPLRARSRQRIAPGFGRRRSDEPLGS